MLDNKLESESVEWVLVGSLGLAIRGAPIEPRDIDIMTSMSDAYKIEHSFSDRVVSHVTFRSSEKIQSHFGELRIDGVKVEVMGDFQILLEDGTWQRPPDFTRLKEVVQFEGMSIPVLSLEWEYDSYTKLGRLDRAGQVRSLLLAARRDGHSG